MFWGVFRYPPKVRFQHMVAVEERHLAVRFYPDLGGDR